MNILIVEDNMNKLEQIRDYLNGAIENANIDSAHSFNSGMKKILSGHWNLIVLDMSLPTYEISQTENGGDKKPVAGRDIMKRMKNKRMNIPVIIITQFETFDDNKYTLNSLNTFFEEEFSDIWKGTVYYGNDDWTVEVDEILKEIL